MNLIDVVHSETRETLGDRDDEQRLNAIYKPLTFTTSFQEDVRKSMGLIDVGHS